MDPMATEMDQQELAQQLLAQAREQGIELVGPGGLLNRLTKNVLETALEAEMDEHLGYGKHDVVGRGSGNSRNGTRTKTVMTEIGPVEIDVPRDTESTFDPQIVKKRQRRLTGVDEIVLSLSAKGLTTGEIAAHFGEVFGARVSKDTISRITEKVIGEMTEWQNRPLDRVYPVVFMEAAFMAEIIRSALLSVDEGQNLAGRALGMSPAKVMLKVVLPQAIRIALPPTGNEFIGLVKFSSLASVISLQELLTTAQVGVNITFRYAEYYAAAIIYYLIIVSLLTLLQNYVEKKFLWTSRSKSKKPSTLEPIGQGVHA
ncbi:transposase [Arthrobacter humicola]